MSQASFEGLRRLRDTKIAVFGVERLDNVQLGCTMWFSVRGCVKCTAEPRESGQRTAILASPQLPESSSMFLTAPLQHFAIFANQKIRNRFLSVIEPVFEAM